jgi:iron complex transport system substrate-binding protein
MNRRKSMSRSYSMLFFAVCLSFLLGGACVAAEKITVTDFHGRSVSLKAPVERLVLLESSKAPEIAAIAGEDFATKIVGWDDDFKKNAGDGYARFVEKFPSLATIPDVGSMYEGTMSVEKVIALDPDVVIAQEWMFVFGADATQTAMDRFEQAGIPLIFLDFWADPLNNSTKSMTLLGKILGQEKRAADIVAFYDRQMRMVTDRLKNTGVSNPSVYLECAYKGPAEYALSYGDVAWGLIVKAADGANIATPLLGDKAKALSPEYVIEQNPDVIVLTGRNWEAGGTLKMGYFSPPERVRATMKPFLERPGWETLHALQNQKVFGVYHGYCFSIFNFAAVQAMAKWFHPDVFPDMDPNTAITRFHERFLPVSHAGTFVFSYFYMAGG